METFSTAACLAQWTEMAYWLCSQTKTTGSLWMAAKFIPSWQSPLEVAPSPNQTIDTSSRPRSLLAKAVPTAWTIWVATVAEPATMRSLGSLKWHGMLRPPELMLSPRARNSSSTSRAVWPITRATPMSR